MSKSKFLDPKLIARLDNMSLKASLVVEGFIVGLHKSPYHGFSVEFSEHRSYTIGDEIRHIDWKLWGKTDKYFIKQFEEETNLKSYILLDQSKSMDYKSEQVSKLEYGQILSASLAYLMLKQQDAVSLTLFDNAIKSHIPPRSKNSHLNLLLSKLENVKAESKTKISKILHETADTINKRGLIILISDLFDDPEDVISGLKHFRYKGHEVIVFHILDVQEIELDFSENICFEDMETGERIITDPRHIREEYKSAINDLCIYYKNKCRERKIDYVPIHTNQKLDIALSEYIIKRKRIK